MNCWGSAGSAVSRRKSTLKHALPDAPTFWQCRLHRCAIDYLGGRVWPVAWTFRQGPCSDNHCVWIFFGPRTRYARLKPGRTTPEWPVWGLPWRGLAVVDPRALSTHAARLVGTPTAPTWRAGHWCDLPRRTSYRTINRDVQTCDLFASDYTTSVAFSLMSPYVSASRIAAWPATEARWPKASCQPLDILSE